MTCHGLVSVGRSAAMVASGGGAAASTAGFAHGFAHSQGRRPTMEDELLLGVPLADDVLLFGVFDGHAGRAAVQRLVEWIPQALRDAMAEGDPSAWPQLTPEAITNALLAVDERLLDASEAEGGWEDGATALLAIMHAGEPRLPVQLVQLGDSQAVLCGAMGAEALCAQHRVGDPEEDARLRECGAETCEGRVVGNGGGVAVTRALGDAPIKRVEASGLIAVPQVTVQVLCAADELLIIGCDGLWDVMEPEEAWDLARKRGRSRDGAWDLQVAATALVQGALDRQTGDNVSVVLVGLKRPRAPGAASGRARGRT